MIAPLWAASACNAAGGVSHERIGIARIRHAFMWLRAFARRTRGTTRRTYQVREFWAESCIHFVCDASPWGYGAVLVQNGRVVSYFYDAVTQSDMKVLGFTSGSSKCQQIVETMAVLIAMRR